MVRQFFQLFVPPYHLFASPYHLFVPHYLLLALLHYLLASFYELSEPFYDLLVPLHEMSEPLQRMPLTVHFLLCLEENHGSDPAANGCIFSPWLPATGQSAAGLQPAGGGTGESSVFLRVTDRALGSGRRPLQCAVASGQS